MLTHRRNIMKFDKNVSSFVKTLNKIKGVYPASSCGGHKKVKGSRCAIGEFWVILRIKNEDFLQHLQEIVRFYNDSDVQLCSFDYNPMYETWCLHSFNDMKLEVFEPFINDYAQYDENIKPKEQWKVYWSYNNKSPLNL